MWPLETEKVKQGQSLSDLLIPLPDIFVSLLAAVCLVGDKVTEKIN